MLIDTHLHLVNEGFDIDNVIKRASDAGVKYLIVSGSDLIDNRLNKELIVKYNNIFLSAGYHPSCAGDVSEDDFSFLDSMLGNSRVVAIGEIGLDYHYGKEDRDAQISLFRRQLDLAVKHNLPVVVHTRDAFLDTYNILKEYPLRGVIHCFSGSIEVARKFIDLGYYLGIGGVVTFKNSKLGEVVKSVGLSRIVFETDSPYLSPYRGEVNEPCNVSYICSYVAKLLGVSLEEAKLVTTGNACKLFDLDIKM